MSNVHPKKEVRVLGHRIGGDTRLYNDTFETSKPEQN